MLSFLFIFCIKIIGPMKFDILFFVKTALFRTVLPYLKSLTFFIKSYDHFELKNAIQTPSFQKLCCRYSEAQCRLIFRHVCFI